MKSKTLKRTLALALAIVLVVSCFAISASAGTSTGNSSTFGAWLCSTKLDTLNDGTKYYYSSTISEKPAKLTIESEYQKYPSGVRYDYIAKTSSGYDSQGVAIGKVKTQQSTIWSFHNWKSSSGTGMTKYTQLVNA